MQYIAIMIIDKNISSQKVFINNVLSNVFIFSVFFYRFLEQVATNYNDYLTSLHFTVGYKLFAIYVDLHKLYETNEAYLKHTLFSCRWSQLGVEYDEKEYAN